MSDMLLHLLFYWVVPIAVALASFFMLSDYTYSIYKRYDLDQIYHGFIVIAVFAGILAGAFIYLDNVGLFSFLGRSWQDMTNFLNKQAFFISWLGSVTGVIGTFTHWLFSWAPFYIRALTIVWVIMTAVQIQALIWRVRIQYALNVIVPTFLSTGWLWVKYFTGHQTPVADKGISKLLIAKLKEGNNDGWKYALQGRDSKGEKFQNGVGGSVETGLIESAGLAIRWPKVIVKTVPKKDHSGFERYAYVYIRNARDNEADSKIDSALKGFGTRLSAPNVRFPENPTRDTSSKNGWFFESRIDYNAADGIDSWTSIFNNPFNAERRVANGGDGVWRAVQDIFKGIFQYMIHFTPMAVYQKCKRIIATQYTKDTSADKAKYRAQQNLDLSVIPEPRDVATGNTIAEQKRLANQVANDMIFQLEKALSANKFVGVSFMDVVTGGSTAVFKFRLPQTAELPNNFDTAATNIANMLGKAEQPQIIMGSGYLTITLSTGVNIPVDFRDMILNRKKGMPGIISGMAGVDALAKPIYFELGDKNPHAMLFGKTGTGKTVTIMTILYSVMASVDPTMLRIIYIDGKGNSFEFMRTDTQDGKAPESPNPFTYAQPADASGDIEYARALISHLEKLTRKRIQLFKDASVTKLADYNKKFPDKQLPEILAVVDEFSAITDGDKALAARDYAEKNVTDKFEYVAKMSRSVGLRMLLANQTARKEKVPGKITANVTGRLSLGVSEPIESEIALPETGIKVHQISAPGEFYSLMNGANNPEHGNSPYLNDDQMKALNLGLWKRFGAVPYVHTRKEIMAEYTGEEAGDTFPMPNPMPTVATPFEKLLQVVQEYPQWANSNKGGELLKPANMTRYAKASDSEEELTLKDSREYRERMKKALKEAQDKAQELGANPSSDARNHKTAGSRSIRTSSIVTGDDKGKL